MAQIPLPGVGGSVNTNKPVSGVKKLGLVAVGGALVFTAINYALRGSQVATSRIDNTLGLGGQGGPWGDLFQR